MKKSALSNKSIQRNQDASPGEITVLYEGINPTYYPISKIDPSDVRTYAVTLEIAEAPGFSPAALDAGTLKIMESLVTMTTAKEGKVSITLRGSGGAVIDWGDASAPLPVTLTGDIDNYSHTYAASGKKIIRIASERTITFLNCHHNQLTSLDVKKNTALTMLWCYSNLMEKELLEALFTSLFDRSSMEPRGTLRCGDNPGYNDSTKQ